MKCPLKYSGSQYTEAGSMDCVFNCAWRVPKDGDAFECVIVTMSRELIKLGQRKAAK